MFCMFVPWHVFDYSCVNLVSWTSMMQFSQFIADWKRLDKGFASNLTLRFPPLVPGKAAKRVIHKEGSSLYMKIWSRSGSLSLEKSIVCSLQSWNGWRWWKQQVRINKSTVCNLCNRPMKIYVSKVHWPPTKAKAGNGAPRAQTGLAKNSAAQLVLCKQISQVMRDKRRCLLGPLNFCITFVTKTELCVPFHNITFPYISNLGCVLVQSPKALQRLWGHHPEMHRTLSRRAAGALT